MPVQPVPTRQIYWNIAGHNYMYFFLLALAAIFLWGVWKHYRSWRLGRPSPWDRRYRERVRRFFAQGVAQLRLLSQFLPGIMHFFISWGMVVLFLGTVVVAIQADLHIPIMRGWFYLYFQSLALDAFGLVAVAGTVMALWLRYVRRLERLRKGLFDGILTGLLLLILVTGFLLEGLRIIATGDPWGLWSPVGYAVGRLFLATGLSVTAMRHLHAALWWTHMFLAFAWLGYIPFSKLFHVVLAPANVFAQPLVPPAQALAPIDFETAAALGTARFQDFRRKDLFDLDVCTECGRCEEWCPGWVTGKPLSPRAVILDLREGLHALNAAATGRGRGTAGDNTGQAAVTTEAPPVAGGVIREDTLWACTTCGWCQEHCPVFIEHVPKTVDMRRYLAMEEARLPDAMEAALRGIEDRGHPWRGSRFSREDWFRDLGFSALKPGEQSEVLYWVGCTAALEERSRKIARAFAVLMREAGVQFGLLGDQEQCSGDPARRMGNEYLFQTLAQANIQSFQEHGVKTIVTTCPHCYNTIKNEYPQFGGTFQVYHHTEFLAQLVKEGRLPAPPQPDAGSAGGGSDGTGTGTAGAGLVTYHDPCYLGRYNGHYDEPRALLTDYLHLPLAEPELSRRDAFCCGAGGGRAWAEEDPAHRVSIVRSRQLIGTGASTVATACPFCLPMLTDGVRGTGEGEGVRVMDIAEIMIERLGWQDKVSTAGQAPGNAGTPV